jgi:DNA repair exonuclease SbcCD ATPase subunit
MMRRTGYFICLLTALAAGPVVAQDAAAAQKALAKAQFLLRQTTAEKAALQQQMDALKQQVDTLGKQLSDSKAAAATRQQSAEQRLAASAGKWRDSHEQLAEQLAAAREQLKAQAQQVAQLQQQAQTQTENFQLCYTNNKKLYDLNRELLGQYNKKGVMDAVKQKEPFTGIKQVEVENLIQDYQYKLDDLNLSLGGLKAPADEGTYTGP